MPKTHSCPCGCKRQIPYHHLACRDGWLRLPQPVRDAINQAWAIRQRNTADITAAIAHRHALAAAQTWYHNHPKEPTP